MIVENINKHLDDKEFLSIIKFFKLITRKETIEENDEIDASFSLYALMFGSEELWQIYNRIRFISEIVKNKIKVSTYSFNKKLPEITKNIEEKPSTEKKRLEKITLKIQNKEYLKINETSAFSWVWHDIYDSINFIPLDKISIKIENNIKNELNKYLDNFINNKLSIVKKNYYTFEKQKQILMRLIEEDKKIKLYGKNFIIKEEINDDCILKRLPDLALGQTIYALEKMDYLKVVDIWDEKEYNDNNSSNYSKNKRYIHVNIILKDLFINELNENFRESNPKMYFEKLGLSHK